MTTRCTLQISRKRYPECDVTNNDHLLRMFNAYERGAGMPKDWMIWRLLKLKIESASFDKECTKRCGRWDPARPTALCEWHWHEGETEWISLIFRSRRLPPPRKLHFQRSRGWKGSGEARKWHRGHLRFEGNDLATMSFAARRIDSAEGSRSSGWLSHGNTYHWEKSYQIQSPDRQTNRQNLMMDLKKLQIWFQINDLTQGNSTHNSTY